MLSIVVPVYQEEKNILEFLKRSISIFEKIDKNYEIIFTLDPSTDRSEEVVVDANRKNPNIKLLKFSRRVGQPMATLAGLNYASGEAVVVMDVDMQDPPELVPELVEKWKQGFDVVYAQRKNRAGETIFKRVIANLGYRFIKKIALVDIPPNTGDFRLMSRRVVNEVVKMKETHGFLRGMVAIVGFQQTSVQFERPARFSGVGNYNRFWGSIRIGMNGIICFSNYLLSVSSLFGFFIAGSSFLLALIYLGLKLSGFNFPTGNPTIVIIVLFMGGIQLISVGILGEYIGRIYDEVKQRPKFIVDRSVGIDLQRFS